MLIFGKTSLGSYKLINPDKNIMFKTLFQFPDPVNEVSARLVALVVALLGIATLLFKLDWMIIVIAYGFLARALTGPTLSPLGQIVTRLITPNLPVKEKLCPGPPKRFAQAIGAFLSVGAAILLFVFGLDTIAYALIAVLVFFALLESLFAFCMGCKVFSLLMRIGVIPEKICQRCNNLSYDFS